MAAAEAPSGSHGIEVLELSEVDDAVVEAFGRLIPQLSSSSPPPGRDQLEVVAASPATILLVARDGQTVLGSLTLVVFRIPTGLRAIIEDVVTDEAARGRGVATALTRAALARAEEMGCRTVDLTSRPSREAANQLYQHLGFTRRDTNVYRYEF